MPTFGPTGIAASGDDYYHYSAGVNFTLNRLYFGNVSASDPIHSVMWWDNIGIVTGSTITSASTAFRTTADSVGSGTVLTKITAVDENDAVAATTDVQCTTDDGIRTTAQPDWDFTLIDADDNALVTADFSSVVQELADSGFIGTGEAILTQIIDDGTANSRYQAVASFDHATYTEPTLTIVYTTEVSAEITPTPVAGTGTIPSPTVSTLTEIVATPLAGTGVIPAPDVSTPDATISATPVAGTGTIPTPTVSTLTEITPTPVAGTGVIPAPDVTTLTEIVATPLAGTGHIPSATVVGILGVMPTLTLEAAFGDVWNEPTPVWTDISAYLETDPPMTISRGNMDPFSRPRPSEVYATLNNQDRRFDPAYAAGPYTGDLVPMVPVRVYATVSGTDYPLFRGFAAEWPNVAAMSGHDPTIPLVARDGLSVLNLYSITGASYPALILAASPTAWWRFSEEAGAVTATEQIGGLDAIPSGSVTFGATGDTTELGSSDRAVSVTSTGWLVMPTAAGRTARPLTIEAWIKTAASAGTQYVWLQENTAVNIYTLSLYVESDGLVNGKLSSIVGQVTTEYYVTSTTTVDDNAWHHGVWTISAADAGELWIDGVSEDTLTPGSVIPIGTPTSVRTALVGSGGDTLVCSEVIVYDRALTDDEIADHAAPGLAVELTSARISRILDLVGWPTADRDLNTGAATMTELVSATTLESVFQALDTEQGHAWVATDGDFTFRNRTARNVTAYAATFSNDGSDIPYQDIAWTSPDIRLRTVAEVTRAASDVTVTASENTATYGQRLAQITTYTTDATEPQPLAGWLANTYSTPHQEATLTIRLGRGSNYNHWTTMLGLELGDLVNVEVTPKGGGAQTDWDMFIETIDLTLTGGYWQWALGLSNAENQRMFILDDPVLGRFDTGGLLGW